MATSDADCSICLQPYVHPVELPCGHVFCFLCIKGCALHRRRCPMCRGRFSMRFIDDPKLVNLSTSKSTAGIAPSTSEFTSGESLLTVAVQSTVSNNEYRWFYEGFAGWWQYDERTSEEIESAFSNNVPSCDVQVAGYIYTIDFVHMTQKRRDNSGRKRRIKRDLKCCPKKGIAGIKLSTIEPTSSVINNNGNELSASIPNYQPDEACPDSLRNLPVISSTSSCCVPHYVASSSDTLSLSETSGQPRIVCTMASTSALPLNPVVSCVSPISRSRSASRGNRTLSLTRPSPSPVIQIPSSSSTNRTNDSNRQPGLRVSRSVPRQ